MTTENRGTDTSPYAVPAWAERLAVWSGAHGNWWNKDNVQAWRSSHQFDPAGIIAGMSRVGRECTRSAANVSFRHDFDYRADPSMVQRWG